MGLDEEKPLLQGKNDIFRELPRPRQPQSEKNNEKNKFQNDKPQGKSQDKEKSQSKEFTITIKPWKFVKPFLVLLVLLGVFLAGRLSVGEGLVLPDFSTFFSSDAGPSGLATGDAKEAEELEASTEAAAEEVTIEENKTKETPAAEDELAATENETDTLPTEETDDSPERFVDEGYEQVTLSLDGVYKEWKETWGRIKGVKYTITNNEKGTVKPHHFSMIVEGYEDGEKKFDVGIASQRIKSEKTVSDEAAVSDGFSYSPVTIPDGDLTKVRISLFLLDVNGETMASVHQEVDLSGN